MKDHFQDLETVLEPLLSPVLLQHILIQKLNPGWAQFLILTDPDGRQL